MDRENLPCPAEILKEKFCEPGTFSQPLGNAVFLSDRGLEKLQVLLQHHRLLPAGGICNDYQEV